MCQVAKPYNLPYDGTSVFTTVAGETIESTYRHPYWVMRGEALASRPWLEHLEMIPSDATTPGRWVDSCDLQVGDELLLLDGRIVPVERVHYSPFKGTVYNMEVEELHCYSVGRNSVLVHNNNGPETGPGNSGAPTGSFHGKWLMHLQLRRLAGVETLSALFSQIHRQRLGVVPSPVMPLTKCKRGASRHQLLRTPSSMVGRLRGTHQARQVFTML